MNRVTAFCICRPHTRRRPRSHRFSCSDTQRGKPEIFVAHGVQDDILPIAYCARTYASALQAKGYSVECEEFEGVHELPDALSTAGMNWLDASWGP